MALHRAWAGYSHGEVVGGKEEIRHAEEAAVLIHREGAPWEEYHTEAGAGARGWGEREAIRRGVEVGVPIRHEGGREEHL